MQQIFTFHKLVRYALCAAFCVTLITGSAHPAAAKSKKKRTRAITKPKFNPNAEKVDLWKAMDEKQIKTRVVAKNEKTGRILFLNKTNKPLTILLPESFVAVPINAQFGGGGFGGGRGGGGGGGFFSIPPQKTVSIPFKTVCLVHGKKVPHPKTKLKLVPTEMYTKNPALRELISIVGNTGIDQNALQAATWHITNRMSWDQLAEKSIPRLGGSDPDPYFTNEELIGATKIVSIAVQRAKKRMSEKKNSTPKMKRDRFLNE
ncbi:hypothetical protein MNBD_PLANCTO02-1047 [hydrothermal vent metagenome]|uniref:Uncharacterized protein n=1 Tax=hydrothermal vent metagenome TaxID=652676 RepID=A0A3B1DS74_9ZZZZ